MSGRNCSSVVVLDAVRGGSPGLGHRFGMLVFGLDLAARTGSRVALADDFWDVPERLFEGAPYDWCWRLLPFPRASQVRGCEAEASRRSGAGAPIDAFLAESAAGGACGCRRVQAGLTSCSGRWCFEAYEGAFDRMSPVLRTLARTRGDASAMLAPRARTRERKQGDTRGERVTVLWHLRTGDNPVNARNGSIAALKEHIDRLLPIRTARHVVMTLNPQQLWARFPYLRALGFEQLGVPTGLPSFRALVNAEVLVSTGSSYALFAAALADVGRQVHFQFPPKELGMHTFENLPAKARANIKNSAAKLTPATLQLNGWFRTYFARTNSVPLFLDGQPLPPYEYKMHAMLSQLDALGRMDHVTARAEFEYWLPPSVLTSIAVPDDMVAQLSVKNASWIHNTHGHTRRKHPQGQV